jgi:hypothetical protein
MIPMQNGFAIGTHVAFNADALYDPMCAAIIFEIVDCRLRNGIYTYTVKCANFQVCDVWADDLHAV